MNARQAAMEELARAARTPRPVAAGWARPQRARPIPGYAAAALLAVAVGAAGLALVAWGAYYLAEAIRRSEGTDRVAELAVAANLALGLCKLAEGLLMVGVAGALALLRDIARLLAARP